MAQKYNPRYNKRQERSSSPLVLGLVLVMTLLVVLSLGIRLILDSATGPAEMQAPPETLAITESVITEPPVVTEPAPTVAPAPTEPKLSFWERLFGPKKMEPEPTLPPEPEHVVSTATISVTGDILMHLPVIRAGQMDNGGYNFDYMFQYLLPYTTGADFAVANLETTLSGNDAGYKYSGYPAFNCPDAIVDALKNAGFDMLLTANNHCYDTSEYGFRRTVRVVRDKGLLTAGTRAEPEEPTYTVQDINGIKVGMVCYTYEGQPANPQAGVVYMNQNALSSACGGLINSFLPGHLDSFYTEVQQCLEQMKQEGAEATMMFIHWGEEYQTVQNGEQTAMAQQLCDLGFDVIVGGHPHVIQPVSLLTSRVDPDHRTVCLYSTGNAVSNQRIKEMNLKTGHTEDGVLFSVTFSKYSDDTVYLEGVELLPCWVDLRSGIPMRYDIIPLDASTRASWETLYNMNAEGFQNAVKSYDRTLEITGSGMNEAKQYLANAKEQREADYLAAVTAPLAA